MKTYFFFLLPLLILASCKKFEEDGTTFQAEKKLTKSWVYSEKILSDGTVYTPVFTYIQTFNEDGTMLLTSDYDTAFTVSNWKWEFVDGKTKIRSTLGNWDTYIFSDIVKLTDTEFWIKTQLIDNGEVFGLPDLEKHIAL
ncbi:MAG: hypothetical protein GQ574_01810 [Crocinitomix sp.]|nr:hypothetical protein [Crocinitomix sp.]